MGAPTSTVEIANIALDHLGQPPIAALSNSTTTGALMLRHFDASRQEVLSKGFVDTPDGVVAIWKFARGRAVVTRTGAAAFDYTDKYALPSDFIAFQSIEGSELWLRDDYDIDKLELLVNASGANTLNLRYTKDVLTVPDWTANFRELVALTLAKATAYAITRSNNDVERMALLLQSKWGEVKAAETNQPAPKMVRRTLATEIVNQALDILGVRPVKSVTSPTTQLESTLATHLAQVRKETFSMYWWKFAKTRATLSRSGAPTFEYADAYPLPADCITLLAIENESEELTQQDYDVLGRSLNIDAAGAGTIKITYIKDETDTTLWDADFTKILIRKLALACSFLVKGEERKTIVEILMAELQTLKPDDRAIYSRQNARHVRQSGLTEICNQALDYLGLAPIKSVSSPTTQMESTIATHVAQIRQECLRTHIWKFAKARATIVRAGTPEFDYTDYYTLPTDCVRLLSVSGERIVDQEFDYDISGRKLQANLSAAADVDVRYVKDETDVTLWDPGFKKIFALHLAEAVGPLFDARPDKLKYVAEQIAKFKPSALAVDAQEVRPKRIQRSRQLELRTRNLFNRDPRFYDFS